MLDRILMPLDGSETAEAILPQVKRILQRHDAEVILLQAVPVFPPDFHISAPGILADAERYIRRMTFLLVNSGVRARGFVRPGEPASAILDLASEERASFIAMSTHGRTGLNRWVFGSVAEKVLRASPVPVLVVRSFPAPAEKALSRGRLEALPLRHILIPTDGSERSLGIVGWIREFAHPIDARVVLLHVIEDPMAGEGWRGPAEPVKQAERGLLEAGIPVTTAYRRGDPAIEILAACEEHSIDLLAMSTHGRSGPSRWAFGSVTEKVLRASNLPMLVARVRARGPSVGPEVGSALQIKL